jgi:hypothetical protein
MILRQQERSVKQNYIFPKLYIVNPFHLLSSQMQANPKPGHFWMSYTNGLAGSSPKFASRAATSNKRIAGNRRSTVGLIEIGLPVNN